MLKRKEGRGRMKLHEGKFIYIYTYQGTGGFCPDGDASNDITRAQLSSLDHLSIAIYYPLSSQA